MSRVVPFLVIGGCFVLCVCLSGCASHAVATLDPHSHMETLTDDSQDHYHRVYDVAEQDRRAMGDDLDLLFMTDRPTRLSRWHSR